MHCRAIYTNSTQRNWYLVLDEIREIHPSFVRVNTIPASPPSLPKDFGPSESTVLNCAARYARRAREQSRLFLACHAILDGGVSFKPLRYFRDHKLHMYYYICLGSARVIQGFSVSET